VIIPAAAAPKSKSQPSNSHRLAGGPPRTGTRTIHRIGTTPDALRTQWRNANPLPKMGRGTDRVQHLTNIFTAPGIMATPGTLRAQSPFAAPAAIQYHSVRMKFYSVHNF